MISIEVELAVDIPSGAIRSNPSRLKSSALFRLRIPSRNLTQTLFVVGGQESRQLVTPMYLYTYSPF